MFQRKVAQVVKRVIWRMSSTNPAGAYLSPTECESSPRPTVETHERGFHTSSFELVTGSDVCETGMEELPGDLHEEFATARR
jgi:hypothetical protein